MKAEIIHLQVYNNSKLASSLRQEIFQYGTKDSGLGHKTDLRNRTRVGDEAKRADEASKIVSVEGMRQNSLSGRNKGQSSTAASCAKSCHRITPS